SLLCYARRATPSFPTRRSSDLQGSIVKATNKIFYPADTILTEEENQAYSTLKQWRYDKATELGLPAFMICSNAELRTIVKVQPQDRKSTRLNSSHVKISYAVFC